MTRGEWFAAALVALVLIGGTAWYFVDRQMELNDFRDDVVAMDFTLAISSEENPKRDESDSELEALVIIDGCWLVELEREDNEDRTLPDTKGRKIEMIVFGEIHSAPNFLNIRKESDVRDFNDPLSPTNVSAYLNARRDQYPCAS